MNTVRRRGGAEFCQLARLEGTDAAQCGLQPDAHAPNRAGDGCLFNNIWMSRGWKELVVLFSRQLRRKCGWEGARPHSGRDTAGFSISLRLADAETSRHRRLCRAGERSDSGSGNETEMVWRRAGSEVEKSRWTASGKKTRFKTETGDLGSLAKTHPATQPAQPDVSGALSLQENNMQVNKMHMLTDSSSGKRACACIQPAAASRHRGTDPYRIIIQSLECTTGRETDKRTWKGGWGGEPEPDNNVSSSSFPRLSALLLLFLSIASYRYCFNSRVQRSDQTARSLCRRRLLDLLVISSHLLFISSLFIILSLKVSDRVKRTHSPLPFFH